MQDIVLFSDVDKNDLNLVGGKGANLGELYRHKIPVPDGFIVTSQVYFNFLKSSGALDRIRGILYGLDVNDPISLEAKANACKNEIKKIHLSKKLVKNIVRHYQDLVAKGNFDVAVRSSATAEDLPGASFAGQQSTFLNIRGEKNLIKAILDAWASLFEARAIFYRSQQNFDHFKVGIAIPVQQMVQSEVSGVMFTIDPVTQDKGKIVIEAVFGLGEMIVSGQITPDHYEVDKKKFTILIRNISLQNEQLVRAKNGNKLIKIAKPYRESQKIADEVIIKLAKLGAKIEDHYYFPQDIEWAFQNGKIYIVQTRPVTALKKAPVESTADFKEANLKPILSGAPASPVIAWGKVVIVKTPKELFKVQKGDVLVTPMTNPDYVTAMRRAVAIITDRGGRTSHAAIVSRELGIACVVGTGNATKKLQNGMLVTVDGSKGLIFKGQILTTHKKLERAAAINKREYLKTATKLYVNLAEPELAAETASKNIDGVGLLRAEFMLAEIGTHPKQFIFEKRQDDFIERLTHNLCIFGKAFGRRPVIYRASDLKSNEYRNLKGGDKFEPLESNPMLGYRGAFRYIKDPDVFKLELAAIKSARIKYPNIHLMIPYVRNVNELRIVREVVDQVGLFKDKAFKFWMMVEIPSNVILLEDFINAGIDGISIGSNDLTMLLLGTDRDNQEVAQEFSELDPAVLWALEKTIKTAGKNHISCSICGQGPSIYPDLTQKLVSWGITSISVNPDAIDTTRQLIYEAEKKIVNNKWQK
ncbi:pyruvate, water dikinase [Candidatus Curtissbacteria bacterium RIFCSPHIGHO2_02_FULL_40_17]|uniref:Phosphoenolpyruvate synthase n=3 Tax=Candidatus Curtissiibacteriota TaxID=1752717 RepID=A0A1F5GGT3_9BACT|nr:MAG: pyruvate, water dikinase [Candidatus Curtissbacteria bacterium RIFCSPHIGHO2_01_FULL_40_12]OGD91076.1 MAG: pyruvate, water dikinase [Candidatus Curtissbacteria bacterium RIFCSPHIGHO2_02_FULL_40_17]OGE07112.1 MAG: pyruvate, water dikinase [Candidatus Curtissbacteria bacterium RIFCSPLOWO2_02_FULL_40_13b]